mgnify:FL=1
MLKNKLLTAILLLSALLCGCSAENSGQNVSETSALTENTSLQAAISDETPTETSVWTETALQTDISAKISETTAETTPETEPKSTEQLSLEALIDERAGGKEAAEICFSIFDDFDGDGTDELFAVYGKDRFGTLWYANANEAWNIYPANEEWGEFRTAEVGGDTLILTERLYATGNVTYCFRVENGSPIGIDTFNAGSLTQTNGAEFTGIKSTYDFCTDGTGHTWKPYWFYYENGEFREHLGHSILYENFKDNFGGVSEEFAYLQPYFDEIEAENGVITNVIVRDNGIININYKIVEDGKDFLAYRYFRTLSVKDGEVTDITPEINEGNYAVSVTGNLLDLVMY